MRGYLAGYPVVDFRVILKDGSYHDVDSNELSFRMAGRIAFRKCMEQARPAIIEPIMKVQIDAPESAAGTLMGDLNGRRGKVQGMESHRGSISLRAEVPMAEMLSYGADLTAMTQGLGSFPYGNGPLRSRSRRAAGEDHCRVDRSVCMRMTKRIEADVVGRYPSCRAAFKRSLHAFSDREQLLLVFSFCSASSSLRGSRLRARYSSPSQCAQSPGAQMTRIGMPGLDLP